MSAVTTIPLIDRVVIPQVGLGVFQVPPDDAQRVVEFALEAGYRHIDTAAAYNNESGVGAAIKASGLRRDEVFVTTKLRNGEQGYDSALQAYGDSCQRLGLDAVDLYLIHWPNPAAGRYVDSWRALTELYTAGRVRAIGVSNFLPEQLDELGRHSDLVPAVNQVELHPTFQQRDLVADSRRRGIAVEAYSPLGQGADLGDPAVRAIAEVHAVTPAQVVLRWHVHLGHIVIAKSVSPQRIQSNRALDDFVLSAQQIANISALDSGNRTGNDPRHFSLSQIR